MYCEGVKYSLNCLGASMFRSGSMVTGLFALQVLSISGSKGISSESSDRRPSIHPTAANRVDFLFVFDFTSILSTNFGGRRSKEECPKRVLELWTLYK